jgi:hypothetical protein
MPPIDPKPTEYRANTPPGDEHVRRWIQTYTGKAFDLFDPQPDQIDIRDIAHALGFVCRFGGHSHAHYSVAEHSIHVANLVPAEFALAGLLHDAAEAYIGDMVRPLKLEMPAYQTLDDTVTEAIFQKFGIAKKLTMLGWESIKHADNSMLALESTNIWVMGNNPPPRPWAPLPTPPTGIEIQVWTGRVAEQQFLERFLQLGGHLDRA